MKSLFTVITLILFSCLNLAAQSERQKKEMQDVYAEYQILYTGEDETGTVIGWENFESRKKKVKQKAERLRRIYLKSFPILMHLIDHMDAAIDAEPDPIEICNFLDAAVREYERIPSQSKHFSRAKYKDYKDTYGINLVAIQSFYNSSHCKEYHIKENIDCESIGTVEAPELEFKTLEPVKEESISQVATIEPIKDSSGGKLFIAKDAVTYITPNNETYSARNAIILLRDLLSQGAFETPYLELEQLVPGDSRDILQGTAYELKFKSSDTKRIILFPGGQYIISDGDEDKFWNQYKNGVLDLNKLILYILHEFGDDSFQILFQGSADNVEFSAKKLTDGFDTNFFQEIHCLDVASKNGARKVVKQILNVGNTYLNDELPDLRAAFLKFVFGRMDQLAPFQNRLHILKGRVDSHVNEKKRNCTITIFIDWDKALEHAEKIDQGLLPFPNTRPNSD